MKRSNSRNQQISQNSGKGNKSPIDSNYQNQDQRFNKTSNPTKKQAITNNTGTLSRYPVGGASYHNHNSDLHKASTQQREEIQELMHQIEMPDDSLTISSLSQSPWNTRSRQNFSATHGTNENSNSHDNNEGTLIGEAGTSEILEGTVDGHNRTLSITRRQNQTSNYLDDADDTQNHISQDYDDSQMIDQDDSGIHSNQKGNNYRRRQNHRQLNDTSQELSQSNLEEDDSEYNNERQNSGKKEYSPDFNRHSANRTGNDDDLTVSNNTVISNTNRTYRSGHSLQNRAPQNRTFADSVIKHANYQTSGSNNNTHRNNNISSSNQESQRNNKNLIQEQEQESEDDDGLDRSCEDEDNSNYDSSTSPQPAFRRNNGKQGRQEQNYDQNLDSSEFSQVESFTQTQYSKFSKLGKSKMFARLKADSLDLTEEVDGTISMHRSPNVQKFKNLEHEESLSMTPVSNNNWMMRATNRTTVENNQLQKSTNNPIKQLASNLALHNIKPSNNIINTTTNYNATQVLFGGKHNKSLNSIGGRGADPELEEALEEDSSKQGTIEVDQSSSEKKPRKQSKGAKNTTFTKLKFENAQLNVQVQQQAIAFQGLANELEQRDQLLMQLQDHANNLEFQFKDTQEHLELLKAKVRDESSLKTLRGRHLELAKQEVKTLTKAIEQKDNHIRQLEQHLQFQNQEDNSHHELMNVELKKLISQLDKLQILNESLKKDIKNLKSQSSFTQQEFQAHIHELKLNYEGALVQKSQQLSELTVQLKKNDKQMRSKDSSLQDLQSIIDQKDSILRKIENDKDKYSKDLNSYKERCKDLESELDQIRGVTSSSITHGNNLENNSIYGNMMNMSKINSSNILQKPMGNHGNNYDFEVKQLKDMFNKKLTKAQEESSKYKQQFKDAEIKLKTMEEESRKKFQVSIQQTSEKIEKDQELINELNKVKQQLRVHKQMEQDLRDCFNINEKEDISDKLLGVREELEVKILLEREIEKLQTQLKDAQQRELRLIESQTSLNQDKFNSKQSSNNDNQVSNFTRNLLMTKDRDIEQLRSQCEKEKESNQKFEDQVWNLQKDLKSMNFTNNELVDQISNINKELSKLKDGKDKAEKNVDELKEKLRVMMREQSESTNLQKQSQKKGAATNRYLDEIERKKYEELITMILELDLATDPLTHANLALQESFIDEFEQATKHLAEQKNLVIDLLDHLRRDISTHQNSIQTLTQEIQAKSLNMDSMKRELFKLQDFVKEKERLLENQSLELKSLEEICDKMSQQRQEMEQVIYKLKQENEEVNQNFRKVMRAQEHLHKGGKQVQALPQAQKDKDNLKQSSSGNTETERLMMGYEDQVAKLVAQIDNMRLQSKEQEESLIIENRQHYREEMLDMLDKLIDSSTKMPTFNDLAMQLASRVDKVRNQERIKISNIEENNNSLKESNGNNQSENKMIETFKQEMDSMNNENELIQSINKWLKQSGGNLKQQQAQFKNFFNQEDNRSLMLSELLPTSHHQQPSQSQLNLQDPQPTSTQLAEKDQQISDLHSQLQDLQSKHQYGLSELINKHKDEKAKLENEFEQKMKHIENEQKERNNKMWYEVEVLKEQIKLELIQKTNQLDLEFEEMDTQRNKQRETLRKQQEELDLKYAQRIATQEKEFSNKLKQLELDLTTGIEATKQEHFTALCKQLEDQYNQRLKTLQEDHSSQLTLIKKEILEKVEDTKRLKDRELKKSKEDMDKLRKAQEDKIKKIEMEWSTEKECFEREWKEKVEQANSKGKKEVKTAQEKVRAEMRNQIDSVKNEMAKVKAEFEREKKKLLSDFDSSQESLKRDLEELHETAIKTQKAFLEKLWKKKLDQLSQDHSKKLEEIENETQKIKESHKDELKKEKDQIDRIKTKYDVLIREERASQIPIIEEEKIKSHKQTRAIINESKNVEVQCDNDYYGESNAEELEYEQQQNMIINRSHQQISQYSQKMLNNSIYVEQLKHNFEEELERQQQVFEVQLITKQQMSVKIFEELLTLEFDKILQSIYHKSQNAANTSQQVLEIKRNEINKLIADILGRNDDRKEHQMRSSLELIKKKISELLRVFKNEVENKLNKKYDQMMNQQIQQERLKIQNMSDIISQQNNNVNNNNISDIQSTSSANYGGEDFYSNQESKPYSYLPTPRHIDMQPQRQQQQDILLNISGEKKYNQQLSDVKNYTTEEAQDENILKKISPVPNSQGVLVVEVDKVVRDLSMLKQTLKIAKFYRVLLNTDDANKEQEAINKTDNGDQLQNYRQLLNELFRIISKMNNGIEQLTKQSEVYKLKLLNTELRDKLQKYQNSLQQEHAFVKVEEILNLFNSSQKDYKHLIKESHTCLTLIENTQFTINKLQFKLYQLLDLFTIDNDNLNQSLKEININCAQYIKDFPTEVAELLDQQALVQSQISPAKKAICAELLSPEETAQLIANVFQKLNQTQENYNNNTNNYQHINQNNDLESYQSFFQTFLSNDEYVKSAENFIVRYREQQMKGGQKSNKTTNYSSSNLPLQVEALRYTQGPGIIDHGRSHQSMKIGRSRSQQSNNHNQSAYTSLPQFNNTANNQNNQTYTSNVFQSNLIERPQQSFNHNQQHHLQRQTSNILVSNYDILSQQNQNHHLYQQQTPTSHNINYPSMNHHQSQQQTAHNTILTNNTGGMFLPRRNNRANVSTQEAARVNINHQSQKGNDEVSTAQSNVNALFEKLKNNFQTSVSHNASKNHSFQ